MAETETTEDEPETVEVNRDIPCEIYAIRGGRLAGSPTPRAYLTLTFDAVRYSRLAGLLMANLKGTTTIHVVDIQAPLEDEPEGNETPVPKLTPQMELPEDDGTETVTMTVNGAAAPVRTGKRRNGSRGDDGWTLHAFKVNTETPGLCAICHHRTDDDLHANGWEAHAFVVGEVQGICAVCGGDEPHQRHDRAKRPHIFEIIDGDDSIENALLCALCGGQPGDPRHVEAANALSPLAQTLIESIDNEPIYQGETPAAVEAEA